MAKDTNKTTDVAGLLASTDLDELDKQIADRREVIKKLDGEIYSLELVRRSVEAFKNGRPERKVRKPKKTAAAPREPEADSPAPPPRPSSQNGAAGGESIQPVVRIKRFLDKIGAAGIPAIARETGLTPAIVAATLQDRGDAFVCKPGNIWKPR